MSVDPNIQRLCNSLLNLNGNSIIALGAYTLIFKRDNDIYRNGIFTRRGYARKVSSGNNGFHVVLTHFLSASLYIYGNSSG